MPRIFWTRTGLALPGLIAAVFGSLGEVMAALTALRLELDALRLEDLRSPTTSNEEREGRSPRVRMLEDFLVGC